MWDVAVDREISIPRWGFMVMCPYSSHNNNKDQRVDAQKVNARKVSSRGGGGGPEAPSADLWRQYHIRCCRSSPPIRIPFACQTDAIIR